MKNAVTPEKKDWAPFSVKILDGKKSFDFQVTQLLMIVAVDHQEGVLWLRPETILRPINSSEPGSP
jgi:hypothetical protein